MQKFFSQLTMLQAVIIGVVLALAYYFLLGDDGKSLEARIANARRDLATAQTELKATETKLEKAREYQRAAAEMGEELNRLLSYIPDDLRVQDLMKIVSEEAKIAGLNIIRVTPREGSANSKGEKKDFEETEVDADFTGNFAQHMTFMSNLTKQKLLFTLPKLNLNRENTQRGADVDTPSLSFRFNIKAYRYVGEKPKA